MGHATYEITRGARKGERDYAPPPTLNVTDPADQRAMVRHHINLVSFYAGPDRYVSDGHVSGRRGPRSKFNVPLGTVFDVWPHIFNRIAIEKLRGAAKLKADIRKAAKAKAAKKRKSNV